LKLLAQVVLKQGVLKHHRWIKNLEFSTFFDFLALNDLDKYILNV
jgi:hypothetical protein